MTLESIVRALTFTLSEMKRSHWSFEQENMVMEAVARVE